MPEKLKHKLNSKLGEGRRMKQVYLLIDDCICTWGSKRVVFGGLCSNRPSGELAARQKELRIILHDGYLSCCTLYKKKEQEQAGWVLLCLN